MNKLTKVGVSALCGSLAAVTSANAGDMTVTGGVDMTWMNLQDAAQGTPIGIGSNLTFTGSGELDNGTTFAVTVANLNANAYSNTHVVVTVPGIGDIRVDQGSSGTGIDRMDDLMPTAWEEAYGHGIGSGIQTVNGSSAAGNIEYTPSFMPDGVTLRAVYAPSSGQAAGGDKSTGGAGASKGAGYDLTGEITSIADGLKVFAGFARNDQNKTMANYTEDEASQWTAGATYAVGGFTIGYQYSWDDLNESHVSSYENDAYGVSFNVNDDLTLSYGKYESKQDTRSNDDNTAEATSYQIAYSVGGASIRLADGSIDNANYVTAAGGHDKDGQTLSVSLAF